MRDLLSLYSLSFQTTLVYMLQNTDYQPGAYLSWYWRTSNFNQVVKRRTLDRTKAAQLLLVTLRMGMLLQIFAGLGLIAAGLGNSAALLILLGAGCLLIYPVVWAHLIVIPLLAGRVLIQQPKEKRLIEESKAIFANHPGIKIAVAGSYGKTTMKELLATVLSESKKVAATPGNKNVSSSHAFFASRLTGDEDILIIEYGEGQPGDVARFADITKPSIGVITGLAPAHLDRYPSLAAAGQDIFRLADYLCDKKVYVNGESIEAKNFIKPEYITYDRNQVDGWDIENIKVDILQTTFEMTKKSTKLHIKSGLIGRHQVGPLAAVAAIAHELGLTNSQIENGCLKTKPYEHRMQPYGLGGAWIIDDTYNGNLEGIRAGLELLKDLPAKRRIYVTPGLVDQGVENERVHRTIGGLIASAKPDQVVLMQNSVTSWIMSGLKEASYQGEVKIEAVPLNFYSNLKHFVASGDVVLMQNDWTDNYS
jgi:UDP-N-acetylmuramoyl-tripeptide--D-alanyl-D-alanine ligase